MPFGRKRGAQKNNTNARKHGFYAAALHGESQKILRRAHRLDAKELKHEIDLLRTRMFELTDKEPDNITVLQLTMRTLVRLVAINHGLNKQQEDDIHQSMRDLVQSLLPPP